MSSEFQTETLPVVVHKSYTTPEQFAVFVTPATLTPAVWQELHENEYSMRLVREMSLQQIHEAWEKQNLPGTLLCLPLAIYMDIFPLILVRVIQDKDYAQGTPNYALLIEQSLPEGHPSVLPLQKKRKFLADWSAMTEGQTVIVRSNSKQNIYRSLKAYKEHTGNYSHVFVARRLSAKEFTVTRVSLEAQEASLANSTKYAKQKVLKAQGLPIPPHLLTDKQKAKQTAEGALEAQAVKEIEEKIASGALTDVDLNNYAQDRENFIRLYIRFYLTPLED